MSDKHKKGKKVVNIKDWPSTEGPRETLLQKGPEALSDAAILAVLLGTGGKGKDVVALSREILKEFGGFHGLTSATYEDLLRLKGMGKAKTTQLLAAMEIVKRQLRRAFEKVSVVQGADHLFNYLRMSMGNLNREEFRLLHLNRSNHLITEEILRKGPLDLSTVHPREVVESALRKKASALILAHNHPTGLLEVSEEDIELTLALVKACWMADIPILDHILIGRGGFRSMKRDYPDIFAGDDEVA
jgi:DNA repair protein RadC